MPPTRISEPECVLAKTKNGEIQVVKWDDVRTHREKNKLKMDDEISWHGKNRNERGRGVVLSMGTKAQCQSNKATIDKFKPNATANSGATTSDSRSFKKKVKDKAAENDNAFLTSKTVEPVTTSIVQILSRASSSSSIGLLPSLNSSIVSSPPPVKSNTVSQPTTISSIMVDHDSLDDNAEQARITPNSKHVARQNTYASANPKQHLDDDRADTMIYAKHAKVSRSMYLAVIKQNNKLLKQIEMYQTTWMPRPTDLKTIKFLVEIGRLLSGEAKYDEPEEDEEKGEKFARLCDALGMDADDVESCVNTDSITKTCRSIVSKLVPKDELAGKSWSHLSSQTRKAVLEVAKLLNPCGQKTDGELTRACRNVFEVATSISRKKEKEESEKNKENSAAMKM